MLGNNTENESRLLLIWLSQESNPKAGVTASFCGRQRPGLME